MEVGIARVADDQDFEKLKLYLDNHEGWKLDYDKTGTKVWTKARDQMNFKMIKVF